MPFGTICEWKINHSREIGKFCTYFGEIYAIILECMLFEESKSFKLKRELNHDPQQYRYGCFLPDLTRLATVTSMTNPPLIYCNLFYDLQVNFSGIMSCVICDFDSVELFYTATQTARKNL